MPLLPALIRGIGTQVLLVTWPPDDAKNTSLLCHLHVSPVSVIPGKVVFLNVTDLMKRRRLEENLRLPFEEICGHVDDERLGFHLIVIHHSRKHVTDIGKNQLLWPAVANTRKRRSPAKAEL